METISAEYLLLFNTISRAVEELGELKLKLVEAQQKAEGLYIEADE